MKKQIKNGKVCVLISIGYGSGWYSWNPSKPQMLFDPYIVNSLLENKGIATTELEKYCEETYPDAHLGGIVGLRVEYVTPGTKFRIDECDGAEAIIRQEDDIWIEA